MPTLSTYTFEREFPQWAGPFDATHIEHRTWAVASFTEMTQRSAMARLRPDNEALWRVFETLNNDSLFLDQLDQTLTGAVTRNGPVSVTYAINANRNLMGTLILIISIPIDVRTPWFCWDTTATLRYFALVSLASGSLAVAITGSDYILDGWTGACDPDVHQQLRQGVAAGEGPMQDAFSLFQGIFNLQAPFRVLYLLPGDGRLNGRETGDADTRVCVAAIPS